MADGYGMASERLRLRIVEYTKSVQAHHGAMSTPLLQKKSIAVLLFWWAAATPSSARDGVGWTTNNVFFWRLIVCLLLLGDVSVFAPYNPHRTAALRDFTVREEEERQEDGDPDVDATANKKRYESPVIRMNSNGGHLLRSEKGLLLVVGIGKRELRFENAPTQ
eukprot:gene6131-4411_t